MPTRIRTTHRAEAETRLAWLVSKVPEIKAKVFLLRRTIDPVQHQEIKDLDNAEIVIKEIPEILIKFPEADFVFRFFTNQDETKSRGVTNTLWTITQIVKPISPKDWFYNSFHIGVTPAPGHCQTIQWSGGLEVYSFCSDD